MPRIRGLHPVRIAGIAALLLLGFFLAYPSVSQAQIAPTVRFAWPLAWPLSDPRLRITNYFDHDPSPGIRDFSGGTLTYNGHQGTDFNVNSFEDMDAGVPILAAANGRVVGFQDDNYDHETTAPNVPWNFVQIVHGDGTISIYGHLRTHSVTVAPGEYVREGQMIGFMGSSGLTTGPHLHFQVQAPPFYIPVDPWGDTSTSTPGLWKQPVAYVGFDHLRVHDLGVTTGSAFLDEGALNSSWSGFKYRPSQPVVFGEDEPILKVWTLTDGQAGDPYTIEVHRPDGSLFGSQSFGVATRNYGQTWESVDLPFTGTVSPADYGEWDAQVISNGAVVTTDRFTVGETSVYAPRFHWVGGRSFHLTGQQQEDILSLSFLGAPMEDVTFTLENAPFNVSLTKDDAGETVVVIGYPGPDLFNVRSREFSVVATDPAGLQDRMHYHLVNLGASTLGVPPTVTAPGTVSATEGDSVVVDVSAGDADGDSIATLTANLGNLPAGSAAAFTPGPGNTGGRLVWHTAAGSSGTYPVTFQVTTSLGAVPTWGFAPIVQTAFATTSITVASHLRARAFTTGGDKTLRLFSQEPRWCLYVEPMDAAFDAAEIDPASVQLVSHGTGSVDRISTGKPGRATVGDVDRNSISDLEACFSKADLRNLFSAVNGRRRVDASVEGRLLSGAAFTAPVSIDVQPSHGGPTLALLEHGPGLALSPNPARGAVAMSYRAAEGASARIDVFDVAGRRVKQIDLGLGGAAVRTLTWDGSGPDGSPVPSGIYWVQLTTGGRRLTQRVVLLEGISK